MFFTDGVDARKPEFVVSRSERSALVSNHAAEHELRVALRSINNMKQAAAQAHDHQRHKFLGSLSDDIFTENIAPEFPLKRLLQRRNSRSMSDITGAEEVPKTSPRRPDSLQIKKSSSQGEIELPNIQKKLSPVDLSPMKSPSLLSPRDADPLTPVKQLSNGKLRTRTSQLALPIDASLCPNSPLNPRNRRSDKLDINVPPAGVSGRARTSSFTSSPEERIRASSFSSSSPSTSGSLPSPRKLRAQVEKNIRSNLEASRQEALKKKRLLQNTERKSWEDQLACDQIEKSEPSSDSDEDAASVAVVSCSPYSISSAMKISAASRTFEKQTGKHGLKAWMGKQAARSPKKK